MADAIPSRIAQINGVGDPLALFLKVFSGRVLTAFLRKNAFRDRHYIQTIASGKSAQFPATGLLTATTHTPGAELVGQILDANEKVVNIEGKKVAHVFIADIDQLMSHYDYNAIVAEQIGQALAKLYDQDVSRTGMLAARQTAALVSGVYPAGLTSTEINAAFATDGPTIVNGIYDAAVTFDQRDVPEDDRYGFVRPLQFALIVKDGRATDLRFNEGREDLGGFAMNDVRMVANIPIIKTNNYAATDDRTNTLQPSARQHDYSTSQALIMHKSAVGTVALTDVAMESWWDPLRQGNHMLGKYICGHDWLRPEAAFELQSGAPAG